MDNIKIKETAFNNITNFSLSGIPKVEFINSDSNKVKIIGPEDQISKYTIEFKNSGLFIYSKEKNQNDNSKLIIYIYTKNVSKIKADAIGFISIPDILNQKNNNVSISGAGNVSIVMNVENINCSIEAAATVTLSGKTESGMIKISAVSSLNTNNFNKGETKVLMSAVGSSTNI